MTTGGRAGARWFLVISAAAPFAQNAYAGAWTLPAKASQTIATVSRETNGNGQTWRADDYTEIGMGGGWGFNLKVETENRIGFETENRTGARAGLQKSFALGDRGSLSITASYLGGESLDGPDCEGNGYEARVALGTSFALAGREGFVNLEGGSKDRENNCHRSFVELTAGLEVVPKWTILGKAWSEDGSFAHTDKIEANLLYDWDDKLRIGAGWREEVSGDFEEKGWVVSIWKKY